MKFLATLLAGLAMANPAPADPAPAPEGGSASIIMINMNMANIQVTLKDTHIPKVNFNLDEYG